MRAFPCGLGQSLGLTRQGEHGKGGRFPFRASWTVCILSSNALGQAGRTPWVECWGRETWDRWPQDVGEALNLWEFLAWLLVRLPPHFTSEEVYCHQTTLVHLLSSPSFLKNPNSLSLGQSSRDSSFLVGMQMICSRGRSCQVVYGLLVFP